MGKFIEEIIIKGGINKDIAPGSLDYSGRRILNPLRDVLNGRYLTSEGEEAGKVENIRGTELITSDFSVYQEVTSNGDFIATIDPWLQLSDGTLTWFYSSSLVRVSSSASGAVSTNTIYQLNTAGTPVAGELARFTTRVNSTFPSMNIYGRFLDSDLNILSTFHIGTVFTTGNHSFEILKEVPEGTAHFGFYCSMMGIGASGFTAIDYFKVEATVNLEASAGLNKCIGTYENVEKNALFFWIWNSNGYHGVFKLDGGTNAISQILADSPNNPVLKFDRDHLITGAGMIGDILTWTDGLNPQRYINVTRAYTTLSDQLISLAKIGPKNPPTFTSRATDSTVSFNKLASDSFQFAYQYVYQDNEISVLSPYSALCTGDILPEPMTTARAKIQVSHTIDSSVSALIKEIRLLYRKNNEPTWYVWKQVTSFSTNDVMEYFYNNEQGMTVPESQSDKLFDLVPNKSKALTIFRGRIFLNIDEEGFDFTPPTISCALASDTTLTTTDIAATNVQSRGGFLKKNGSHLVGIFFRDKLGRLSGIASKASINGSDLDIVSTFNINNSPATLDAYNKLAKKFNVTLAGTGPADCEYFIAMTKEQNYASYMQVPAHILWYNFDADLPAENPYYLVKATDLRFYQKNFPGTRYKYIHFLLPKGLPFVPDTDCYVRFVSANITRVERVLEVLDGDIVVTANFGVSSWTSQAVGIKGVPLIEIFKPNTVVDPFFYQVAGPYTTDSDGVLQTTSISNLSGDAFYLWLRSFNFKPYQLDLFEKISSVARKNFVSPYLFIESPSPITKSGQNTTVENLPPQGSSAQTWENQTTGLQPDHTKIASSKGWPLVEAKPLLQRRPATLRFSDPYVEGSEVNGLNSFPVGNVYDKIGQDRSPITKLVPVGNLLVAVHERHVTSIYVGEGIVRTGETGFITKVENVVGDDRKLAGEMGSYHPESVREVDGQLFGYDIYTGVIWRYTVEGIFPISDLGMMNYFKERSKEYFPYRDQLKFVASVDKYHKEYLITLPHLYLTKQTENTQDITSTTQYNFLLDDAEYTVGETYRIKIIPYNQTSAEEHRITIDAYFDDGEAIAEDISHLIDTNSADEAEAIYLEFTYDGQSYIAIHFSDITVDIHAAMTSEYQSIVGETWAFNYKAKVWAHRYAFVPEHMGTIGNSVILFKDGNVYKHSQSDTHNNFFGVQHARKITVSANPQPGKDKTWSAVQIDCDTLAVDEAGSLKVIEVSNDKGQASYTRAKDFQKENGVYGASILKDVNTNPLLLPAGSIALRDGKDMRSKTLDIVIHNDSTEAARMQKINIVGEHSEFSA